MQNSFWPEIHSKFKKYFKIQEKPGKIEKNFYKTCEKYLPYISKLPGIQMIWIGNSISMNCASENSDIDLFIVTSPNRLWSTRLMVTFIFQILWKRKTEKKHKDNFCLSFFATTHGDDFENFAFEEDIYLYFWTIYMKPLVNFNKSYEKFIEKNNSWANFAEYKNNFEENKKYIIESGEKNKNVSKIWDIFETFCKKLLLPKTLRSYEKIGRPFGVIIHDDLLKFHNDDIRKKIKSEILGR